MLNKKSLCIFYNISKDNIDQNLYFKNLKNHKSMQKNLIIMAENHKID